MNILNIQKNTVIVGRASTAIYLILKSLFEKREVIISSNVCYAAVFPILYSNNIPVFVDVDMNTGNMNLEQIKEKVTSKTKAIIYPYMYGNINKEIFEIKKYCEENKIVLIEDCASSMGATIKNNYAGSIGDYSVFSTGHAKILDLGNGGFLSTNHSVDKINELKNSLPVFNKDIEKKQLLFDSEYKRIRYVCNNDFKMLKKFFQKDYKSNFIYNETNENKSEIIKSVATLDKIIEERKRKYNLYYKLIHQNTKFKILNYNDGSVPWRFSILVENINTKKELINLLLNKKLFVSDWYPCIAKYFTDKGNFDNALLMEEQILNFSLTITDEEIINICDNINCFFGRNNEEN